MKQRIAKKIYWRYNRVFGLHLPGHYQIKEVKRIHDKLLRHIDPELSMPFWIYDERTGYPKNVSFSEHQWFLYMCGKRFLRRTHLPDGGFISSVCLGIDHNFYFGPLKQMPIIFECMYFKAIDGEACMQGEDQERAATRGEILKIHDEMLERIMGSGNAENSEISPSNLTKETDVLPLVKPEDKDGSN